MALSRLKPDSATTVGILTAAGVFLIYSNALPSVTDVRVAPQDDGNVETARRHAAIESAVLIGAVFLIARDLNSYIISGAALVGLDLMYKHANAVSPHSGKVSDSVVSANVFPLPDYGDSSAENAG